MFDRFVASFRVTSTGPVGQVWRDPRLVAVAGYTELAERFAGCSFENGLYRLHDAASGPKGEAMIASSFPDFAGRACPFGYDWLGRQLAVDSRRAAKAERLLLLMEPGTGEALEIPMTFAAFHDDLSELREPALAAGFFEQWATANPDLLPLKAMECVGYRVPLFLGGKDTVDNLELIDLEVYWMVCGQLQQRTRTLPPGTSIHEVSTTD